MVVLPYFLIVLIVRVSGTELEIICQTVDPGRSFYLRGSCFHIPTGTLNMADTFVTCHHHAQFGNGHVAFLVDELLQSATKDFIANHGLAGEIGASLRIGGQQTSTSGGVLDYWYWITGNNRKWSMLPKPLSRFSGAEPDSLGQPSLCMLTTNGLLISVGNDAKSYMCQYHDHRAKFMSENKDKRPTNDSLIEEHWNVDAIGKCGILCKHTLVCQSFSYSKAQNNCLLYMFTGNDLNYEAAIGYDTMGIM